MSFMFNADEIFAMAEGIEENGELFYRKAAEHVADREAKDFLIMLANFEVEHRNIFRKMRQELSEADRRVMTYDPNNEAALYLSSLAGTKVFGETDTAPSDLTEIFRRALAAEKDSIAFYLGMKDLMASASGKETIDEIIREEMRHIRVLGERLGGLRRL